MHARDKHVLVIGPVKNSDASFGRNRTMNPPKEIVIKFLRAWLLERRDGTTLRIDTGHDVFYGAVFPRGIHSLQHDQKNPFMFCVQQIVQCGEFLHMSRKGLRGMALGDSMGIVRFDFGQVELGSAVDPQSGDIHPISF